MTGGSVTWRSWEDNITWQIKTFILYCEPCKYENGDSLSVTFSFNTIEKVKMWNNNNILRL